METSKPVEQAEIETVDNDLEVIRPEASGGLDSSREEIDQMRWLAKNIGEIAELNKTIFLGLLKMTVPGDFIIFGSGDKRRAEIGTAACERIAKIGVNITEVKQIKEMRSDDKGSYYNYVTTGTATFRNRSVPVISIVSSRDKFYGKEDGKLKENWEISEGDVQKASWRGILKEGVKTMLGLRRLDPAELESYGVKLAGFGGHTFKNKEEKAAGADSVTVTIEDVKQRVGETKGKPWTMFIIKDVEGAEYVTFSETFATVAKNLKGKQATIQFTKTERGCNLQAIEAADPTPTGK